LNRNINFSNTNNDLLIDVILAPIDDLIKQSRDMLKAVYNH
jgi:hypothetical protein